MFTANVFPVCLVLCLVTRAVSPNSVWVLGEKALHPNAYLVKTFDSRVQGKQIEEAFVILEALRQAVQRFEILEAFSKIV